MPVVAVTTWLAGTLASTGGPIGGCTVTVNVPVTELPDASVAVQVTVVTPTGNTDPDGDEHPTFAEPNGWTAVAAYVTTAPLRLVAVTTIGAGSCTDSWDAARTPVRSRSPPGPITSTVLPARHGTLSAVPPVLVNPPPAESPWSSTVAGTPEAHWLRLIPDRVIVSVPSDPAVGTHVATPVAPAWSTGVWPGLLVSMAAVMSVTSAAPTTGWEASVAKPACVEAWFSTGGAACGDTARGDVVDPPGLGGGVVVGEVVVGGVGGQGWAVRSVVPSPVGSGAGPTSGWTLPASAVGAASVVPCPGAPGVPGVPSVSGPAAPPSPPAALTSVVPSRVTVVPPPPLPPRLAAPAAPTPPGSRVRVSSACTEKVAVICAPGRPARPGLPVAPVPPLPPVAPVTPMVTLQSPLGTV